MRQFKVAKIALAQDANGNEKNILKLSLFPIREVEVEVVDPKTGVVTHKTEQRMSYHGITKDFFLDNQTRAIQDMGIWLRNLKPEQFAETKSVLYLTQIDGMDSNEAKTLVFNELKDLLLTLENSVVSLHIESARVINRAGKSVAVTNILPYDPTPMAPTVESEDEDEEDIKL